MSFSDLVARVDSTVISTFKKVAVTIHPKSGAASTTVDCVVKNPVMEEDYTPGSIIPGEDTTNVILFIHPTPDFPYMPVHGDNFTFGNADYACYRVAGDRENGVSIYGRLRSSRWDQ